MNLWISVVASVTPRSVSDTCRRMGTTSDFDISWRVHDPKNEPLRF